MTSSSALLHVLPCEFEDAFDIELSEEELGQMVDALAAASDALQALASHKS